MNNTIHTDKLDVKTIGLEGSFDGSRNPSSEFSITEKETI